MSGRTPKPGKRSSASFARTPCRPPVAAAGCGHVRFSVASYLETELDRAAAAKPNPGKLPLLHRLTRTEYKNAIRDLLALDALPKEMDYRLLLPADNASSGFDNIADLLFVSPADHGALSGCRPTRSAAWPWAIRPCR